MMSRAFAILTVVDNVFLAACPPETERSYYMTQCTSLLNLSFLSNSCLFGSAVCGLVTLLVWRTIERQFTQIMHSGSVTLSVVIGLEKRL